MIRSLVAAAVLLLLIAGVAEWMRRQSLFYPEAYPIGDWDTEALAVEPEDVTFAASDGTSLHGWLFRPHDGNGHLIVYYHGNGGNLTYRAAPAVALATAGFTVFLFDYRGYGRSEGRPTEDGLYDDALAAWDLMRASHRGPMIAYGESLGGPYAAFVASRRDVCAVVADSTFPSIRSVARAVYRPIPMHWLVRPGLETASHLNAARVPVLVMHSKVDSVIPFRLGEDLFDELQGPKELFVSDDAMHSGLYWSSPETWVSTIDTFVQRHCGGNGIG